MLEDRIFRALLEAAPDGIVLVDSGGRIVLVNPQVERMFGYTQAELVGRPIEVIVPARLRSVHNLHRSAFLSDSRPRPMGAGLALTARRKDGSEVPVEISLSPINSADGRVVAAMVRDTSERRRAEETLRGQAEILDAAHDAIVVLDPGRRITYWNAGAERTYGWTAEEAMGQTIQDLLYARPVGISLDSLFEALSRDSIWDGELELTTQDGRAIVVASRQLVRRNPDGSTSSILVIERDITERKLLETERASAALNAQRQAERDRIAMDLHDGAIQSIYAVTLNLETAAEDVGEGEARANVERSIDSLQGVIAAIRSYIFQLRRPDLAGDIEATLEALAANAESAGAMSVSLRTEGNLRSISEATAVGLCFIVQEALANAVRHSGASHVHMGFGRHDGRVVVTIEDDGRGFDTRVERGDSHNGLRNLATRAETLGGSLSIESVRGAGTTITLELPD